MNDFASAADAAEMFQRKNKAARRNSELVTQQRNNLWKPVAKHICHIADYLKKLFTNNEKKAGDWGFDVNKPRRVAKTRLSKLKPRAKKVITKIKIGSSVSNFSNADLHIYKGINLSRTFLPIRANETAKLTKGFSRITVVNQSAIETARFSVKTYR